MLSFVEEGGAVDLNEERSARRASVRAKKFDVVKKEVDKADAARRKQRKESMLLHMRRKRLM